MSPFERLVEETKAALPEVALHGLRRNISDIRLIEYAANEVLTQPGNGYTAKKIRDVMVDLLDKGDRTLRGELVALLLSLFEIRDNSAYYRDRGSNYTVRYRFEADFGWGLLESPHEYVLVLAARAVTNHLLDTGDWVRPSSLAPSRRKRTH
jgi:hypothetical protein